MSPPQIVVILVAIGGYIGLRHIAAKRVAEGDTRWLWVVFGTPIVAGLVLLMTSVPMLASSPLMAVLVAVVGVVVAGAGALLVRRMQRASAGATTPQQRLDAISGPIADHMLLWGGAIALMAVALLIGVLVIGISGGFR